MKKLLCVIPALLLFAMIGASRAHADSYTVTFTCTDNHPGQDGCAAIPSAPGEAFSFPAPTLSLDTGYPITIDIQLPGVDSATDTYFWNLSAFNPPPVPYQTVIQTLMITDQTTQVTTTGSITEPANLGTLPGGGTFDFGTLTFSSVTAAAPEPAPILLMLLGAGLIYFMRKRFIMRIPRTA